MNASNHNGLSYALGFGVLAVVIVSAATALLYSKIPVKDGFDTAALAVAMVASGGLLMFVYQRVKGNEEAQRALVNERAQKITVTDCPDYYQKREGECVNEFKGNKIGSRDDTVKLNTINDLDTRAEQCDDSNFQHGTPKQNRVWTHLKNQCA